MTLYELTEQYMQLLAMAEDADTDPDVLADTMEGLTGELEEKADGYAKVIKSLQADAETIKAEEKRLHDRRTAIENNVDRLMQSLENAMRACNKPKFKTELFSFNIQKNPASVVMDEACIENIPAEYLVFQDPKIDRKKIKEDLQAGKDLDGIAHLEQSEKLRIR